MCDLMEGRGVVKMEGGVWFMRKGGGEWCVKDLGGVVNGEGVV